jgi:hypothetical protein
MAPTLDAPVCGKQTCRYRKESCVRVTRRFDLASAIGPVLRAAWPESPFYTEWAMLTIKDSQI